MNVSEQTASKGKRQVIGGIATRQMIVRGEGVGWLGGSGEGVAGRVAVGVVRRGEERRGEGRSTGLKIENHPSCF